MVVRKNNSTIPRAGMPPADAASFRRYRATNERTTAMERCQIWNCTWDEGDKVRDSVRHKLLRPSGQFASKKMLFKDLTVSEGEELVYWMFSSNKDSGLVEWADLVAEVMAEFPEYSAPDPMPMEPEMDNKWFGYQMPDDYDPEPKRIARVPYDIRLKATRDLFVLESQYMKNTPSLRDETTWVRKRHNASLLPGPHHRARTKNAPVQKIHRMTRRLIVRNCQNPEKFFTERLTSLVADDTNLKDLSSIEVTRLGAEIVARKWTDPVDEFWISYKRRSDGKQVAIGRDRDLENSLIDTEGEKGAVWEVEVVSGSDVPEEVMERS
ncbi:uncharacterized protein MYCFIDRAFT_87012 [Pseudocercospora fijiensis CIRAD86]|uniref:Uncharacterized protein n=1 Tax=Pseudocercospora fijiensis (strain CIRAD86) TaxID=383855 RepID=N1QCS8_PSEFD|nr:uncharacterized protein MYCFIDRAFT_87012 [Pseudocercospora fijiensis CIRAD86]EME89647.1 hypothetical protein MYCFIDRAFT_87012 [Pseudocercospora fijiensis CIRAD86]